MFDLASVLSDVSNLNTSPADGMQLISLDLIDPDPNNFYSLDGIDELAGNIELVGLQQPLVVRPNGSRFTVISGHRRRAACLLIRDGGNRMFDKGVRCIVDYSTDSGAMAELKLIYANSATRVLSGADLQKQAARIEALLYQLKEEGVEFPGRMRDHVAEVCRISASKIARLNAIKKNLIPAMYEKYEAGEVNEAKAYTMSTMHPDVQKEVMVYVSRHCAWKIITESYVEKLAEMITAMKIKPCDKNPDELCSNAKGMIDACFGRGYQYCMHCADGKCCSSCSKLRACRHACEKCTPEASEAEKKRAAEREAETERINAAHEAATEYARKIYGHTADLIEAAGLEDDEYFECIIPHSYGPDSYLKSFRDCLEDPKKIGYSNGLPFGSYVSVNTVKTITNAADALGVSVDELLMHEPPQKNVFNLNTAPTWMTGEPPRDGRYWCRINIEGYRIEQKLEYHFCGWHMGTGHRLDEGAVVEAFYPLPEVSQ